MLFHSYEFIFVFLPITLLGFITLELKAGRRSALIWLALASIVFYAQWSLAHGALLTASIMFNYGAARVLVALRERGRLPGLALFGAIAANLALLGYLKYANFFIDNVNAVGGMGLSAVDVLLPVGISFYTFIQIGFLVEVHNRQIDRVPFSRYVLFASFFPCVTAGPIILQKEMMPQFEEDRAIRFNYSRVAVALTIFGIGLFKKIILADSIGPFADTVFDGVADGAAVGAATAWIGALSYTLQLYFDFSGYSDMALGIGYLFGFRLPINFNSPLKAVSITDFWRRWHMTMTRFFTTYLFSPIALKITRRAVLKDYGPLQRFVAATALPVTITFVLAGMWHGAGWTFIVFGLIHGVALATNHAWARAKMPTPPRPVGWLLTMGVVVVGLVVFRAESLGVAGAMLLSMVDVAGISLAAGAVLMSMDLVTPLVGIAILGGIALMLPNTQEITRAYADHEDMDTDPEVGLLSRLKWHPNLGWAAMIAVMLTASFTSMTGTTEFLYYKF